MRLAFVVLLAGCHALPPVPALPFHASTAADPVDEITLSLVVGIVMQPLGGAGLGAAVRVEQQATARTALGLELTGGYVDADGDTLYLLAARGYGKSTPSSHDWFAGTYGAGLAVLTSGMVSLQVHAGAAVAYPNDTVVPYLSLAVAGALPLLRGRTFGGGTPNYAWQAPDNPLDKPVPPEFVRDPPERQHAKAELFLVGSVGFGVVVGDTGNVVSLDLAVANSLRDGAPFFALSLADTQH